MLKKVGVAPSRCGQVEEHVAELCLFWGLTVGALAPPRNLLYIVVDDLTANLELFGGEIDQVRASERSVRSLNSTSAELIVFCLCRWSRRILPVWPRGL